MSYFNHETFGAGHMPPFESVFDIKTKKDTLRSTISESIEDVEYEEITDEKPTEQSKTKDAPKYDKYARAKEIHNEAQKLVNDAKKLGNYDMLFHLTIELLFVSGAVWSDNNQPSKFNSKEDRFDAFHKEMDKHIKEVESKAKKTRPDAKYLSVVYEHQRLPLGYREPSKILLNHGNKSKAYKGVPQSEHD